MILPAIRDPRLVAVRRGGFLIETDHQLLASWAATCAEHVLGLFEEAHPGDDRPRRAIEAARGWTRGETRMMAARAMGGHAMGAARPLRGAPRFAAYSAGQAACVAHVPEHDLGAAAYAIRAAAAAVARHRGSEAGRTECEWQRQQIPGHLRALVFEDQLRRNSICWSVFGTWNTTPEQQ